MSLADLGHDIEIIAPRVFLKDQKVSRIQDRLQVHQPLYFSFSNKPIPVLNNTICIGEFFKVRSCIRQAKRISKIFKPEIVYAKFVSTDQSAEAVARHFEVPWVVSVGESVWDWENCLIPNYGAECLSSLLCKAGGVETVSQELGRFVRNRLGVESCKVHVIPNGVDTSLFKPRNRTSARERFGLSPEKFLVSFVGADTPNKGARRLLEAIELLPDKVREGVGVMLIGDTKTLAVKGNVEFTGKVAPEEVPWLLAASDIFVLPTTNEGMCNSIIEAMAVGLPVVSSDKDFNREVLCDESGILVNPANTLEISTAIRKLKEDLTLRIKLGAAALKKAQCMCLSRRIGVVEQMLKTIVR